MYVDDCGIGAKDPDEIDQLVTDLRNLGFDLTREGDFTEFLGIKLTNNTDGTITLTQQGLIDKIVKAVHLETSNSVCTPTSGPLGSDPDGDKMLDTWNYRSVVGMLLYLSTNTRVDIAFAVSQVARFSHAPKQSHATAVKRIVKYLRATKDQGMILRRSNRLKLELYVDADFCGLYKIEPDSNPTAVKSRTGFIVMLAGFPVIWKSQLQTSIACSTLEAEYVALSTALRVLLPLKRLLVECAHHLDLPDDIRGTIIASVFEDNQGAYYLATNHRITNRTRYFLNKYHWFWEYASEFDICDIDTDNQLADYLTKHLPCDKFEKNRFGVQGWYPPISDVIPSKVSSKKHSRSTKPLD